MASQTRKKQTKQDDELNLHPDLSSFLNQVKIGLGKPMARRILWLISSALLMCWVGGAMFWPLLTWIVGMVMCLPVVFMASDSFFEWKLPRFGTSLMLTLILFGYTLVQFFFSPLGKSLGVWVWGLTPIFAIGFVVFVTPLLRLIRKGAKRKTLANGRNVASWRLARSVEKILQGPLFWWTCMAIALMSMILMLRQAFSLDVWIDESFSMAMIRHSYLDIIQLTAQDVHPPLFYLLLKLGVSLFCLIFKSLNPIFAARLVCLIPYFILYAIGYKDIRRCLGNFVGGSYLVALSFAPHLFLYSGEIRMYGLSMLWIVLIVVAMIKLAQEGPSKTIWIELGTYSLLTAYTHYYAALMAAFLWLFILWWVGLNAKREDRLMALKVIGFCLLGYAPWLWVLFGQLMHVSADYWIKPIDLRAFESYFSFVLGSGFVLVSWAFFMGMLSKRNPQAKWKEALSSWLIGLPFFIIGCGLFVSFMVRPLYVARYAFAAILPMLIGVLLKSQTLQNPMLKLLLVFCMALAGLGQMNASYQDMNTDRKLAASLVGTLDANFEDVSVENAVIITDNSANWRNLHVMVDYPVYVLPNIEFEEAISEPVYGKMPTVNALDEIHSLLEKKRTILFVFSDVDSATYYRNNEQLYIRQVKQQDYGSTFHELTIFTVELKNLQ